MLIEICCIVPQEMINSRRLFPLERVLKVIEIHSTEGAKGMAVLVIISSLGNLFTTAGALLVRMFKEMEIEAFCCPWDNLFAARYRTTGHKQDTIEFSRVFRVVEVVKRVYHQKIEGQGLHIAVRVVAFE
jgi:hypothetical protein